ncbi:hypothetical protein [Natrarchaeobaculum sulfurireducens]|uniref:Uncharacterized protein n=1 Tax=Natrarchaeobaculum sulfurireducens TaxID=2044521 RepID=A0A346PDV6_9EURY|nr:hypothetical protein [Natrarchaeobaculum sulfurireducens]AXR77701.1 hypothetical protein AArc1_1366 [Natrarchaeobaculum sulfurireducens]
MNPDGDGASYARAQLKEAKRRLESVHDRTSNVEKEEIVGAIDQRTDDLVVGNQIKEIPEEYRNYVVLGKRETRSVDIEGHIQNIIIDCQMTIELSVKSMFKAVGQDFDYSHAIGFGSHNTQGFNNRIPNEFPRREEIVRAIFLTQLWEKFYELAKYGAPELNAEPSVIFDIDDGERAMNDATFCVELAEDFIEYVDD